ncbi:hypothetical protein [Bacillus sp. 03113]|uniref:hypothetical protein n=1 Tax=Bacillus sp. 03113 TaxID=2578211 RepID=UPI0011442923|nr:hypothetical protein [Bacillus sp. 03113]
MFKRLFSFNNPLGIALSAAAIILTLSPNARRATRKMVVKGAAALLSVGDQVKELSSTARKEIGTIAEEAKVEKEQMNLPDFSEMIKNAGETTKSKMSHVFDDMKFTMEKPASSFSHSMEAGEELIDHTIDHTPKAPVSKNARNKSIPKKKSTRTQNNVQNVLSDKSFNSLMGKPPLQ